VNKLANPSLQSTRGDPQQALVAQGALTDRFSRRLTLMKPITAVAIIGAVIAVLIGTTITIR
jgi:hypothetical protein